MRFVNTFKRDYVSRTDLSDARTLLAQLPAAFEYFNEIHPHSSLNNRRYIVNRPCPEMQGQDQ